MELHGPDVLYAFYLQLYLVNHAKRLCKTVCAEAEKSKS